MGLVSQNSYLNEWLKGLKYWLKYRWIKTNFNEIGHIGYKFLKQTAYSNFEVMKLILGLVGQNTYRNKLSIGHKYWSKYWYPTLMK